MPPSLRVYSETLPYADLVAGPTRALLARYELEVVLAVRPWQLGELPGVARALRDTGIALSVWPMLADADGRWANADNAAAFRGFVLETCDVLDAAGCAPRDVLLDLEPPFAQARSLAALAGEDRRRVRSLVGAARAGALRARAASERFARAAGVLAGAAGEVRARGIDVSLAVWPLVALDPPGVTGWQSLLGTPVDALEATHVSVMLYTSILEGWSRGAIRRADATALLHAGTARTVRRWGDRAGISLGCVGTGAFDDEPIYTGPDALAADAAVARAAGCARLSLFDLGGVLARPPAERWLEAFVSGDAAPRHVESRRVRAARSVARAATWAAARLRGAIP